MHVPVQIKNKPPQLPSKDVTGNNMHKEQEDNYKLFDLSRPEYSSHNFSEANSKSEKNGNGKTQQLSHNFSDIAVHPSQFIQPKLSVNTPSDEYEQEADAMADKVMHMPEPAPAAITTQPVIIVQNKSNTSGKEEPEEEKKEPEEEKELLAGRSIQRKLIATDDEEKIELQETSNIDRVIQSQGEPLDKSTRFFMESRFGFDFGKVQIHNNVLAHQSAKGINALAYTHQHHIAFGAGQYRPQTESGKRLLAHELTHVLQQQEAGVIKRAADISKLDTGMWGEEDTGMSLEEENSINTEGAKFIVEDGINPGDGQMQKSQFLNALNEEICRTVEAGLEGTEYTANNCPYIKAAFAKHSSDSPLYIEQLIGRYSGIIVKANNAQQVIELMQARVMEAVENWLKTGDISQVPQEIQSEIYASMTEQVKERFLEKMNGLTNPLFKAKDGGAQTTQSAQDVLRGLGKGTQLEPGTRIKMESAFGADFSHVEIHTDPLAESLTSEMNARAFTVGDHIAFSAGEHQPGTLIGDALIAHELAHVIQQRGTDNKPDLKKKESLYESLETDADNSAVNAIISLWGKGKHLLGKLSTTALPKLKTGLRLQRCTKDGESPFKLYSGEDAKAIALEKHIEIKSEPDLPSAPQGMIANFCLDSPSHLSMGAYGNFIKYDYYVDEWAIIAPGESEPKTIHKDPESKRLGGMKVTYDKVGTYTIVAIIKLGENEFLEIEKTQKVVALEELGKTTLEGIEKTDYNIFRGKQIEKDFSLSAGGITNQNLGGTYISSNGPNPTTVKFRAPDYEHYTYTIHSDPAADHYKWYARPSNPDKLATVEYFGYKRVPNEGVFDLASKGPTATWIIAETDTYIIVCEQYNKKNELISEARYRQVVQTEDEAAKLKEWRDYITKSEVEIAKIQKGKAVAVRAAYVNKETGSTMSIPLFIGPDAKDNSRTKLIDLMPNIGVTEYGGASIEEALKDFENINSYPTGIIQLQIPGYATKPIVTKTGSVWSIWSGRIGIGSLVLAAAGVLAVATGVGAVAAPYLFLASAAAGGASAGLSLADRLRQSDVSFTGVAIDIVGMAASFAGAGSAIQAIRYGSIEASMVYRSTRFLVLTEYTTNAISGVLVTVDGVNQIGKILESKNLSSTQQIDALVRLLSSLALNGGLIAYGSHDVGQAKTRVLNALGSEGNLARSMTADSLHALNALDDQTLKALHGATLEQVQGMVTLVRENPQRVAQLSKHFGGSEIVAELKTNLPKTLADLEAGLVARTGKAAPVAGIRGTDVYNLSHERPDPKNPSGPKLGALGPNDIKEQVGKTLKTSNGGTLVFKEQRALSGPPKIELVYTLTLPGSTNTIEVTVRARDVANLAPAQAHQVASGISEAGPARLVVEPNGPPWTARMEINNRLSKDEAKFVVEHEANEVAELFQRHPNPTQAELAVEMEASLFRTNSKSSYVTAHDKAAVAELFSLWDDLKSIRIRERQARTAGKISEADAFKEQIARREQSLERQMQWLGIFDPNNFEQRIKILRNNGPAGEELIENAQHILATIELTQIGKAGLTGEAASFLNPETVRHLRFAGPNKGEFINSGIYGGHYTGSLREFVEINSQFAIVERGVPFAAKDGNVMRTFDQYRWTGTIDPPQKGTPGYPVAGSPIPPNWEHANVPKTTVDNFGLFLQDVESSWSTWRTNNKTNSKGAPGLAMDEPGGEFNQVSPAGLKIQGRFTFTKPDDWKIITAYVIP